MNRQTSIPESEAVWHALRAQDITSTDAPALFNLSPYQTRFELWHAKKAGEVQVIDPNDRMLWGTRLQDAIADGIAEDQRLVVRRMPEYMRIPEARIGSSFDFEIEGVLPGSPFAPIFDELGPGILEIKNVDWLAFRNGWTIEDDFIEAPPHIEVQVQHQQLVAGRRWSLLGALVGGNRYELLERRADESVHRGIIAGARAFWASIDAGQAPDPVMPDDADAVIAMNQFAEPGKLYDASNDAAVATLVREYHQYGEEKRRAEEAQNVRKAELLAAIGDHEKVLLDGFSVSCGMVGPAEIAAYTRKGYRLVRVTPKKAAPKKAGK